MTARSNLDTPVTYRVPLRSLDSDHTFTRHISVYGPKDLAGQLEELRVEYPAYEVGTPRPEKASLDEQVWAQIVERIRAAGYEIVRAADD